jgi:hypothetical protein
LQRAPSFSWLLPPLYFAEAFSTKHEPIFHQPESIGIADDDPTFRFGHETMRRPHGHFAILEVENHIAPLKADFELLRDMDLGHVEPCQGMICGYGEVAGIFGFAIVVAP